MEYKRKGVNVTEVATRAGLKILFSYGQPVAVAVPLNGGTCYVVTDEFHSRTSSGHVAEWLADKRLTMASATKMSQEELDRLVLEA